MFARLEGHNDPKRLLPTSQFMSGGFGGMVAQYVLGYWFNQTSAFPNGRLDALSTLSTPSNCRSSIFLPP